jgi:hypothetical protein
MECKKCHSKWEPSRSASKTLAECPFCGTSLIEDDGAQTVFDNSKDALARIMQVHGVETLLGKTLKNFFTDYAPSIAVVRKNVVLSVISSGAADILKRKLTAKDADREIAFKQAVQKVIDTYGTEHSLVENVIREFTDALGWKINVLVPASPTPAPAPQKKQIPTQTVQKPVPAPTAKPPQQTVSSLAVGQRNFKFGPYNWRVLDVQNGKALLITEDIVEKRRYHSSYTDITWVCCELRHYLNGAFFQTFSSAEQSRILQTNNTNANNQWFGTKGGENTTDRVFLLSIEEVVEYFGDSGQLRNRPKKDSLYIDDQHSEGKSR